MKSGTGIDFDLFEKLFTNILDDSLMERLLKFLLIKDNMCENDKKMIEILIENDKQIHFIKLRYLFMLEFITNFGCFTDKLNDQVILKITTAGLTNYYRKIVSKKYRYYEKKTIISLENMCLKKFNKNIKNVILKNIEINENNKHDACYDDNVFIKNIYLDSYNNILLAYESYSNLLRYVFDFITQLMLVLLRPLFFEQRHSIIRTNFNIIYIMFYNIILLTTAFSSSEFTKKNDSNDSNIEEHKLKEDITSLFKNINIIIEKNTLKTELLNILNRLLKISKKKDFIEKYKLTKASEHQRKLVAKYKILETISSLIINDAYITFIGESVESAGIQISEHAYEFTTKLKGTRDFIGILNEKPYQVVKTILWNKNEHNDDNEKSEHVFVLQNVTLEYESKDKTKNKVLENINLNFELGRAHFLYGNSGCGKTTLLNALMKRVKIASGVIKFLGIHEEYTYFSIRNYITYIASESALFHKDLYYNITYGINKKKMREKEKGNEITEEITKYMTRFGLGKFTSTMKTTNATKLSKGQMQRVAITRLFIDIIFNDTRILFLDEITSNIDNKMEEIIYTELRNIQKIYNFTIFYVSHNNANKKYSDYSYEIDVDTHSIKQVKTTN